MRHLLFIGSVLLFSCTRSSMFDLLDSNRTGIDFNNNISVTDSNSILKSQLVSNGAGVGIGDLNNDGLDDIVFAGNMVSPKIYLNLGNFKFSDITSGFKGLTNDRWYSSVSIADINSDGLPDVYLTVTSEDKPANYRNQLWINNGNDEKGIPSFAEMAEKYGIAYRGPCINAAFLDYDRDGDLDLFILNSSFNNSMSSTYRPKITDGSAVTNPRLFRNNGNGPFIDVTVQAGILTEGFGLGLAVSDLNKDGYPDIYLSNDYTSNDVLYINQGNGTFRNEISTYLSYQTQSSMGNDISDVNNDGNPDIYTLDMLPESYWKKKQTINGFPYSYYQLDKKYGYEHQYLRNMLHIHNGFIRGTMLPFSEVGQIAGIYQTDWSWSPLFADYDNDGDKDLIVTTGYPKDLRDRDWMNFLQKTHSSTVKNEEIVGMMPPVKIPNVAFENRGGFRFIKKEHWLPDIPSYSYGASFADLDNDGDLDYVVNNIDDKAFVLKNETIERSKVNNNFLRIKLTGRNGNTMAIGAKVELWSNGSYQFYEHFLSRGYTSSVGPVIHFGLSNSTIVDSVRITWPASSYVTILRKVAANSTLQINESESASISVQPELPVNKKLMFSRCDSTISYRHDEIDMADFFLNQRIIPHKFSQLGPFMAKGDIDNDGHEDLIIGATNKLPTTVFLKRGEGFKKAEIDGLTSLRDVPESDMAVLDFDKDGDNDIVAVSGGYETRKESENQQDFFGAVNTGFEKMKEIAFRHYIYENRNGSFVKIPLPVPPFLASVVRLCDFNHDGYTDIFIGSRVKRGRYPEANDSWLLINKNGKFLSENCFAFKLGMVTDALWSDYDKDGWEDLMITREWNSVALLKNISGKELVQQSIPELEKYHGIWYGIASGDFDGDGYEDYIVGNLGDNNRFDISESYPLNLYAIDIENNGTLDPIITAYWKDKRNKLVEYPVNYLDELKQQSSFFQMKFNDYTTFSLTGFKEMFGEKLLKRAEFSLHVNTTSSYVIWNNKGSFGFEKLPEQCQLSPLKKMIVRDLNGDGYPDLLAGGNDYTYDVATGYYDALKGMVLLSREKSRSFDVLPPSASGLLLQGMVESLLWFDGDTSLLVAGINRESLSVYKHPGNKK